jgi:hypothetical protein
LRRTSGAESTIIFVEDSKGYVFGGYVSSEWQVMDGYFGTGESFLFTLYPKFAIYPWDPNHNESNSYFILVHNDHFELGGGFVLFTFPL